MREQPGEGERTFLCGTFWKDWPGGQKPLRSAAGGLEDPARRPGSPRPLRAQGKATQRQPIPTCHRPSVRPRGRRPRAAHGALAGGVPAETSRPSPPPVLETWESVLIQSAQSSWLQRQPGGDGRAAPPRRALWLPSPPRGERGSRATRAQVLNLSTSEGTSQEKSRSGAARDIAEKGKPFGTSGEVRKCRFDPGTSLACPRVTWCVWPVVWMRLPVINGILSDAEKCEMYPFCCIYTYKKIKSEVDKCLKKRKNKKLSCPTHMRTDTNPFLSI